MKLTTRTRYGLRALMELARAWHHHDHRVVTRREIEKKQKISPGYLEQILSTLRAQRMVTVARGKTGGFSLARPPHEINLLEIVSLLEGSLAPVDCCENPRKCSRATHCGAQRAWQELYLAQTTVLQTITLQQCLDWDKPGTGGDWVI